MKKHLLHRCVLTMEVRQLKLKFIQISLSKRNLEEFGIKMNEMLVYLPLTHKYVY